VFLVDDNFNSHPKVMSIPRRDRIAAGGLWLFAGVWCRRHLTDGFVPKYMLSEFGAKPSTASTLCEAKLWTVVADGYQFVDWAQWQDTKEDVQTKREQWRKRQVKHRTEKDVTRDKSVTAEPVTRDSHADVTPVTRSLPVPYPIPNPSIEVQEKETRAGARSTRIPAEFQPSEQLISWATTNHPTVDWKRATEAFRDHWQASTKNALKRDWEAAWRTWVRREAERSPVTVRSVNGHAGPVRSTSEARAMQAFDVARRIQAREDAEQTTDVWELER
jgi:hypothetical protein